MAGQQSEILQKLEKMGNLESVVTEQRMRIEKLKTTYETLKTEHLQLQDSSSRKDREVAEAREEVKKIQEQCQEMIRKIRSERDAKIQECEEMRTQVITPQRMELLKIRLQEDLEMPYKERYNLMEGEIDKYRNDFNKLRYDYSFLKSEYEHEQAQHKQIVDEMQGQFEMEVQSLRKDRDALVQKLQQEGPTDANRVRNLQRENTQLHMKVRGLLSELEEIRAQREASGLQSDHVSRLQARQLTEMTTKCKTLETERDSLKLQYQSLQAGMENFNQTQDELNAEINQLEKENMSQKSQMEEMSHKHKVELSNLKMSVMKNKGDLERERDELKVELDSARNKLQVTDRTVEHLKKALDDKEHEVSKRVQAVRETEWEKITQLEQAKLQLEEQIKQMERTKIEVQTAQQNQVEKLEEELRSSVETKNAVEKECISLKAQLQERQNLAEELEKETSKSQELKRKQQQLQNQCQGLLSSEQQLMASNDKLKGSLELLNEELNLARLELQRQHEENLNNLEQNRHQSREEKSTLEREMTELEKKLKSQEESSRKERKEYKKKLKKYRDEMNSLRDNLQLVEAKEEQLKLEKDTVKRNLELENQKTKRQLEKFHKRQSRFKNMLNNGQMLGPGLVPVTSSPLSFNVSLEQDQQQQTLISIRERLEELESNQRQMSDALGASELPVT